MISVQLGTSNIQLVKYFKRQQETVIKHVNSAKLTTLDFKPWFMQTIESA